MQTKNETKEIINQANVLKQKLEKEFLQNELNPQKQKSIYPDYCIPINADVLTFNLDMFLNEVLRVTNGSIYIFCAKEQFSEIYKTTFWNII